MKYSHNPHYYLRFVRFRISVNFVNSGYDIKIKKNCLPKLFRGISCHQRYIIMQCIFEYYHRNIIIEILHFAINLAAGQLFVVVAFELVECRST